MKDKKTEYFHPSIIAYVLGKNPRQVEDYFTKQGKSYRGGVPAGDALKFAEDNECTDLDFDACKRFRRLLDAAGYNFGGTSGEDNGDKSNVEIIAEDTGSNDSCDLVDLRGTAAFAADFIVKTLKENNGMFGCDLKKAAMEAGIAENTFVKARGYLSRKGAIIYTPHDRFDKDHRYWFVR